MANSFQPATAGDVERIVGEVHKKHGGGGGLKALYCVACGGSLSGAYPLYHLLKSESNTIHTDCISAGEFVHSTPAGVDDTALVFCMSRGGNTPETVAAAKRAKARGATVITISVSGGDELSACGHHHLVWAASPHEDSYRSSSSAIALMLGFQLLHTCENYEKYGQAQSAFASIDALIRRAMDDAKPRAERFAERHQDAPVIYTLGSGPVCNIAYATSICHLMEMEWVHSGAFHTGEFFHGPFEITDREVPFLLFMSSGRTRALDERAKRFLERYTDHGEVLDVLDYGAARLDEGVREFFDNLLLAAVGRVYTETLARYKQHPFLYRRYMFKVEY